MVISHWHDDHIRGAAKTLSECTSAKVSYSTALSRPEFLTLVSTLSNSLSFTDRETSGTREMASIIKIFEARTSKNPNKKFDLLVPTRADHLLFQRHQGGTVTEVRALSPSNASINKAFQEFAALIPSVGGDRLVLPRPLQNHNAIVIWISSGQNSILLGSDLEETSDPYTGWSVIVDSSLRPSGKAKIFKIPHHGSMNGHSDSVWNHMIESEAISLLTTYGRGVTPIPKAADVTRLKTFTPNLYCTMEPKPKTPKRDNAVERTLKEIVKNRKVLGGDIGHIQVRINATSKARVNLKPPAKKL